VAIKRRKSRLRVAAEAKVAATPLADGSVRPTTELVHELQVHQIELEMQNDELRRSQLALEESRDRYIDLYDFAPLGYLSVDDKGWIAEANLTAATLLGLERWQLLRQRFTSFVLADDRVRWLRLFPELRAADGVQQVELTLLHRDGSVLPVRMDCRRAPATNTGGGVRLALTDISELKVAYGYLRALIDNFPFLVWLKDKESRFLAVNRAFAEACGARDADDLVGKTDLDVWPRDLAEAYRADDRTVLAGRRKVTVEEEVLQQQTRIWVETYKAPVISDRGAVLGTVGFARDITERKQVEQQLRVAAAAFEAQEGMMVTDANSVILRVNVAFTDITGYSAAEVIGQTPGILHSDRHDAAFHRALWDDVRAHGFWSGEIWNRRKNGEVHPEWMTITAVRRDDGEVSHYVSTLTDITERKAAADQIAHLAFYDPLTRLPNRRLLLERLQRAAATSEHSGRLGALLFIDLDNFKLLNDTLGHEVGDRLLQCVAERLVACVREGDSVARLGGDEFVVLLEDLSRAPREAALQAESIGAKILASLNQPYGLGDSERHSTPSIGVTVFHGHRQSIDELLKQADLAMYEAKAAGRNALRFFDPEMQAAVALRAVLEADLRQGLRKREFLLHYQPQVDGDGRLTGAEALLRWQHPRRGEVLPGEFIPLAEETGLIVPLGQWVLDAACAQMVAWAARPETARLNVVVNVSARQFRHPDFVQQVLAVLDHSGADPHRLTLELTESALLKDVDETIAKMVKLKAYGVGFSLDDFGTGYSALSYLKRLPLDELKIDQSFVREVMTDRSDAAIARTIIALAQSLGLTVIAEGVETEAQRNFLAQHGCRAFQGYLFGRPGPANGLSPDQTAGQEWSNEAGPGGVPES